MTICYLSQYPDIVTVVCVDVSRIHLTSNALICWFVRVYKGQLGTRGHLLLYTR
jgi:hypothetical protein